MGESKSYGGRGSLARKTVELILYLAGGWRSYRMIAEHLDWSSSKTAKRNVLGLEQAGLPIEWNIEPDKLGANSRLVRLSLDWVEHTPWLQRYIIRRTPLNQPAYRRSLHK